MVSDKRGRRERRLPIMIVVNLAAVSPLRTEKRERTYIDNISARGARVHCTSAWQFGEEAEIIPVQGDTPVRGDVVYCQKLDKDYFFVGLRFRSDIPWSILQRFDGGFTWHL